MASESNEGDNEKNEIDLYGEDEPLEQLPNEELVVGDVDEKTSLKDDEENVSSHAVQDTVFGDDGGTDDHPPGTEDEPDEIDRRQSAEADDLFDSVIVNDHTSPKDENGFEPSSPSETIRSGTTHGVVTGSGTVSQAQRKNSCYVGNLTWWTTDQDMIDLVSTIDISDLIDVKFYENRANGQSKGFALLSFDSDNSVRVCMEHLATKELHSQTLVVLPYTKQSLAQLEAATASTMSATRKSSESGQGGTGNSSTGGGGGAGGATAQVPPLAGLKLGPSIEKNAPTFLGVLRIGAGGPSRGPMQFPGGPGHMGMNQMSAAAAAAMARSGMGPPGMGGLGHPHGVHGFPHSMHLGGGPLGPHGMPGMVPPPLMSHGPPHGIMSASGPVAPPSSMMRSAPMQSQYAGAPIMAGHHHASGGPPAGVPQAGGVHVNPNFYPGLAAAHQQQQTGAGGHPGQHHDSGGMLGEAEFEEIMNRNRTVSSSAISRAVSDAAAGDYASAIETLVTALSLIRQSKVAHDDRCKVLIGSLQDTLHGIETKSYGGSSGSHHGGSRRAKDHGSSRDRSRSRDRAGGGSSKRRRRSRSRSRDRYGDSPRRSRRY